MDSIREGGGRVDSISEGEERWTVSEKKDGGELNSIGHGKVGVGQYQERN